MDIPVVADWSSIAIDPIVRFQVPAPPLAGKAASLILKKFCPWLVSYDGLTKK
jgi:hypothetical protein